nr:hypothetical protein [Tanacetum cinerariifolium]
MQKRKRGYPGFDQTEPPQYSVNPSLNIQNEPSDHELFISKLIQQKLQNEYAQPFLAIAITLDLPTGEPEDSLRTGNEHFNTILETESDKFIKYSVENRVPNPSEFEDLSDSECDVPAYDDFTTFLNLLFDADDDFSCSDNKSFSDEDISKEIYSNPLFDEKIISMKIDPHHFNADSDLIEFLLNHDSSTISSSSKVDSLLDEFAGELTLLKSIPPGIDKTDCDPEEEVRLIEKLLYDNSSPRPLEEFISENSDATIESFSPSPIPVEDSDSFVEEIDLSFTPDDSMPSSIEEDDYDSERDMLIFEELLSNDSLSLPENESFHFDIPSFPHPPTKPPDNDSRILTVKMVDNISKINSRILKTHAKDFVLQSSFPQLQMGIVALASAVTCRLSIHESSQRTKNDSVKYESGHLAARLGCAETKVVTWDDLAFKLITLGWNEKHKNYANR